MHVGFTGTQEGMTLWQKEKLEGLLVELLHEGGEYFHHGDCTGADAQAHDIALGLGYKVVLHPPENPIKRAWCESAIVVMAPEPYLERNQKIVDACDPMIAAPKEEQEQLRSGTWSTVRRAQKKGCSLYILRP
ncbi:MAG: hypothetical protein MN733_38245 [Nitrososphaera sp.]|nr:hypothetical protein [Nitrososphaera sp.]